MSQNKMYEVSNRYHDYYSVYEYDKSNLPVFTLVASLKLTINLLAATEASLISLVK